MAWLILDTAADWLTVALIDRASGVLLADRSRVVGLGHAESLFPEIEAGLSDAGLMVEDIEGVAVAIGPGSFTGVRIAISAANGFAQATGCPVRGVSVHDAIAATVKDEIGGPFVVALDARRNAVYAARYAANGERVGDIEELPEAEATRRYADVDRLGGNGAGAIALAHQRLILPDARTATAMGIARAAFASGSVDSAPPLVPLYIRGADAKTQAGFALPHAIAGNV